MLVPRLGPPLQASIASIGRKISTGNPQARLNEVFSQLTIKPQTHIVTFVRHASHKAQGAVNTAKDGPGKRLGAKKSGEQYVIPGNIIFRQRGTHWFPGENCGMGRDHTIYALQPGYVKYYKDLEKHPKRQYIGVVFERDQVLPLPRNSQRRRKLGMVTSQIELPTVEEESVAIADLVTQSAESLGIAVKQRKIKERRGEEGRDLKLRPGYMYREANWEIGRAAERAKVKVKPFKPRDRWTAWRKSTERRANNVEKKNLRRSVRKT